MCGLILRLGDVLRLGTLLTLANLVGHLLAFLEVPKPFARNGGEVYEYVLAPVVWGDEAVALILTEPLHRSLWQTSNLLLATSLPEDLPSQPRIANAKGRSLYTERVCV